MPSLKLISHHLCPYVQRAAIVLQEKRVAFERIYVDLANKPDWFLAISPLGKTPVLMVGQVPIFESTVICEYLEDTIEPGLHPRDVLERAVHRGWVEFGSSVLDAIGAFYSSKDEGALQSSINRIYKKFDQVEQVLADGPYFGGERFTLVDATFGPVFRYFDVFDQIGDFGFFHNQPKVRSWRNTLSERPSVRAAVAENYPMRLLTFIRNRGSFLSQSLEAV